MNHHQAAQASITTNKRMGLLHNAILAGYRPAPGSPESFQIMEGVAPLDMTVGQAEQWRPHVKWEWSPGVGLREKNSEE